MKQFINLTSRVINKFYIVAILKKPSKYIIHMNYKTIDGIAVLGTGFIWNDINTIEICETKNKQDYDTITKVIAGINHD